MSYSEDQFLPISGLQHLVFCRRQCALIHLECQWRDNLATIQGRILHKKADKPGSQKFGDSHTTRSMMVHSYELGLYGVMDLLVQMQSKTESSLLIPRELKRGRPKKNPCDRVQLCAQALCLEEMSRLDSTPLKSGQIEYGEIFYGKTRRRIKVEFTPELRRLTKQSAFEFHLMFETKFTPPPEFGPKCKQCSIKDICLPEMQERFQDSQKYLSQSWSDLLKS